MVEHVARPLGSALDDVVVALPEAPDSAWYPNRFMAPLVDNEPQLSEALEVLDGQVSAWVAEGLDTERIVLAGFSQGACLVAEWLSRRGPAVSYVVSMTGALIGPEGTEWTVGPSLVGASVFISGTEEDPWVPTAATSAAAQILASRGATVECTIRPPAEHGIDGTDVEAVARMLQRAKA